METKKNKSNAKELLQILSGIIFILVISSTFVIASAHTNLISNSGFENGTTYPLNWKFISYQGNIPVWDTIHHDGSRSIKISRDGNNDIISGNVESDLIKVEPSQNYIVSAWGKMAGIGGSNMPRVRVVQLDSDKKWIKQINLPEFSTDSNWSQRTLEFRTSDNALYLYIYANIWNGFGTIWIDDVELSLAGKELSASMTEEPSVSMTGESSTQIITTASNTQFEKGIKINSDKTIKMDGKKVFPLMMISLCDMGPANNCLNNLQKNDIYDIDLIGTHNPESYFPLMPVHEKTGKYVVSRAGMNSYNKNLADNPSFFGYYQTDEPENYEHDALKNIYTTLKQKDPGHPIITGVWKEATRWLDTADIIIFGLYPFKDIFISEFGSRERGIYGYEHIVKNNILLGANTFDSIDKPVWPVIQAVGCKDEAGVTTLSQKELRVLEYTAITMNIKGLAFYSYLFSPNNCGLVQNSELTNIYINMGKEIKLLNDILVLPTSDYSWEYKKGQSVSFNKELSINMLWKTRTNFNYMLKQDGNTWYLIVVNKDARPISDVEISVSGPSGVTTATTLGLSEAGSDPGRVLSVNNNKFIDSFEGFGVHIYKLS